MARQHHQPAESATLYLIRRPPHQHPVLTQQHPCWSTDRRASIPHISSVHAFQKRSSPHRSWLARRGLSRKTWPEHLEALVCVTQHAASKTEEETCDYFFVPLSILQEHGPAQGYGGYWGVGGQGWRCRVSPMELRVPVPCIVLSSGGEPCSPPGGWLQLATA